MNGHPLREVPPMPQAMAEALYDDPNWTQVNDAAYDAVIEAFPEKMGRRAMRRCGLNPDSYDDLEQQLRDEGLGNEMHWAVHHALRQAT